MRLLPARCMENGTLFRFISGHSGQTPERINAAVMVALAMDKPITLAYDESACTVLTVLISR
jgi:hypothetical protein